MDSIENSIKPKTVPRASGIYQIVCMTTGKVYVGSAVNLRQRWLGHRTRLRLGVHHNNHLQAAWDMYGEANFSFQVLELVDDRSNLLDAEQRWIDETNCTSRDAGFNVSDVAGGGPGTSLAQVWPGFYDPAGSPVTITNLFEYCRLHELDWPSMHRLAMGKSKLKSYKGWTHENSRRQRAYVKTYVGFISPEGLPVGPITNLAAFCREHGLENSHMVAVARGRLRCHKGWTHVNARPMLLQPKTYNGFISPDGERTEIRNLAAFCRQHGLSVVHMHNLRSGIRKSHKGWTWRNPDD